MRTESHAQAGAKAALFPWATLGIGFHCLRPFVVAGFNHNRDLSRTVWLKVTPWKTETYCNREFIDFRSSKHRTKAVGKKYERGVRVHVHELVQAHTGGYGTPQTLTYIAPHTHSQCTTLALTVQHTHTHTHSASYTHIHTLTVHHTHTPTMHTTHTHSAPHSHSQCTTLTLTVHHTRTHTHAHTHRHTNIHIHTLTVHHTRFHSKLLTGYYPKKRLITIQATVLCVQLNQSQRAALYNGQNTQRTTSIDRIYYSKKRLITIEAAVLWV